VWSDGGVSESDDWVFPASVRTADQDDDADGLIVGADFSDLVFAGQRWSRRRFVSCRFVESDLRELATAHCEFTECDFSRADLGDSAHVGSAIRACEFTRTTLSGIRLRSCSLLGSRFTDCRMRPITITDSDLSLVSLGGLDLRDTELGGLRLREANLVSADLRGASLRGCDLSGARLSGARLDRADLRDVVIEAGALLTATVTDAQVGVELALDYARAHGLWVEAVN
jgi:uncharacterized protein YjbI with pentapeptide repeats